MNQNPFSLVVFVLITYGFLTACSSQSVRERLDDIQYSGRPKSAAYAAENFYLDNRSPEPAESRNWEFYYKHCLLEGRTPYPPKSEYNCTGPY